MRAITITTPGGPEALMLTEIDIPRPGPGQILVRVQAAAVNPVDAQTRNGTYHRLGWVTNTRVGLGWDLAGVIEEVGPELSDADAAASPHGLVVGMPVAAVHAGVDEQLGAYAQYAVLDASAVALRPDDLDPVAAATVPLNGTTAAQALDLLGPARGRSLLVTGAAGAVGAYVAQLALERGFIVTGLARSADHGFLRGLGVAHTTVLPERPTFAAVLDAAALGRAALEVVMDAGAYVGVVPPAVPAPVRGITTTAVMVTPSGALLTELLQRTVAGELPARVHSELPLEQAAAAHTLLERGGLRGRIVLHP